MQTYCIYKSEKNLNFYIFSVIWLYLNGCIIYASANPFICTTLDFPNKYFSLSHTYNTNLYSLIHTYVGGSANYVGSYLLIK